MTNLFARRAAAGLAAIALAGSGLAFGSAGWASADDSTAKTETATSAQAEKEAAAKAKAKKEAAAKAKAKKEAAAKAKAKKEAAAKAKAEEEAAAKAKAKKEAAAKKQADADQAQAAQADATAKAEQEAAAKAKAEEEAAAKAKAEQEAAAKAKADKEAAAKAKAEQEAAAKAKAEQAAPPEVTAGEPSASPTDVAKAGQKVVITFPFTVGDGDFSDPPTLHAVVTDLQNLTCEPASATKRVDSAGTYALTITCTITEDDKATSVRFASEVSGDELMSGALPIADPTQLDITAGDPTIDPSRLPLQAGATFRLGFPFEVSGRDAEGFTVAVELSDTDNVRCEPESPSQTDPKLGKHTLTIDCTLLRDNTKARGKYRMVARGGSDPIVLATGSFAVGEPVDDGNTPPPAPKPVVKVGEGTFNPKQAVVRKGGKFTFTKTVTISKAPLTEDLVMKLSDFRNLVCEPAGAKLPKGTKPGTYELVFNCRFAKDGTRAKATYTITGNGVKEKAEFGFGDLSDKPDKPAKPHKNNDAAGRHDDRYTDTSGGLADTGAPALGVVLAGALTALTAGVLVLRRRVS
ncbi:hypothetical protein [Naumannella huperziae]